uniref:Uncharacterized protein n=1 Tax=Chromera velia CCMP2878 TaxID=1169474 RepID=A0A0G4F5R5_9ALVE|eukprot:Cvel_15267.t1-p1 / transcript=Cvel_15267.t1 / gene=Cvel_15267 / organism=Chromera_velia_CCMP2878 / gene_product=hypothetical protein / transcript_product=hypothetical protein / location=Cvel_scaffold1119:29093-34767(+) / protein_length=435 / sequence_SO=supercontig / SO=protein_coding / is_pseudo=false
MRLLLSVNRKIFRRDLARAVRRTSERGAASALALRRSNLPDDLHTACSSLLQVLHTLVEQQPPPEAERQAEDPTGRGLGPGGEEEGFEVADLFAALKLQEEWEAELQSEEVARRLQREDDVRAGTEAARNVQREEEEAKASEETARRLQREEDATEGEETARRLQREEEEARSSSSTTPTPSEETARRLQREEDATEGEETARRLQREEEEARSSSSTTPTPSAAAYDGQHSELTPEEMESAQRLLSPEQNASLRKIRNGGARPVLGVHSAEDVRVLVAHTVLWTLQRRVFGGFVRDWVIGQRSASTDIDVLLHDEDDPVEMANRLTDAVEAAGVRSNDVIVRQPLQRGIAHKLEIVWAGETIEVDLVRPSDRPRSLLPLWTATRITWSWTDLACSYWRGLATSGSQSRRPSLAGTPAVTALFRVVRRHLSLLSV